MAIFVTSIWNHQLASATWKKTNTWTQKNQEWQAAYLLRKAAGFCPAEKAEILNMLWRQPVGSWLSQGWDCCGDNGQRSYPMWRVSVFVTCHWWYDHCRVFCLSLVPCADKYVHTHLWSPLCGERKLIIYRGKDIVVENTRENQVWNKSYFSPLLGNLLG